MQEKTVFKGYRIEQSNFTVNPLIKNETFKIAPRFECKLTGDSANFTAALTVMIDGSTGDKTPFDLKAVISGAFSIGADVGGNKSEQLRMALVTLFPYLRAFVSTLTTACGMPPFILPYIDVDRMVASMREQNEYLN